MNTNKVIKYVKLGSSALRLTSDNTYYRDAGIWEVEYKLIDGKLFSVSTMDHLNNVELIPITEEEWYKDNEGYVKLTIEVLLTILNRSYDNQCVNVLHDRNNTNYNEPIFVLIKEIRPDHKVFFESLNEIRNEKGIKWKPKFDYYISDLVGLINNGSITFIEDRNHIEV